MVGAPRAGVVPNPIAPSISPQQAIERYGPLVVISPVPSSGQKPVFEFGVPLLNIKTTVTGEVSAGVIKNPLFNPVLSKYNMKQWLAHLALWCQGVFSKPSRFNSNVHSEIGFNVFKNEDLQGAKNLSVRKLVTESFIADKAAMVRLAHLATEVESGPAPKKRQNRQLVEGFFDTIPEPAKSDEEDHRPASMPRKRGTSRIRTLRLLTSSRSVWVKPNGLLWVRFPYFCFQIKNSV